MLGDGFLDLVLIPQGAQKLATAHERTRDRRPQGITADKGFSDAAGK
jgi:hypothetical protein